MFFSCKIESSQTETSILILPHDASNKAYEYFWSAVVYQRAENCFFRGQLVAPTALEAICISVVINQAMFLEMMLSRSNKDHNCFRERKMK